MTAPGAFTQLLDRGLAAEGSLARWCPTMDLLALATADGQLHVHRLNWQRLWWTSPGAPITVLEWRPDGKQLGVGLEDGTVLLLDTEDGEVQHKAQLTPGSALVALSWTRAAAPPPGSAAVCGQLSGDRTRRLFAPPPPPVPAAGAGLEVGYGTCGKHGAPAQAWPEQPSALEVLACAAANGDLLLCSGRLFPLARVTLPALLGCADARVLRVAAAPSLQQLSICWRGGGGGGGGEALRLSVLATPHLGLHAPQLHRLASEAAAVEELLQGCQLSWQAAVREWGAGQREFDDSRARLAAMMADYATSGEPAAELQRLLARGEVGGALRQYLTSSLGEAGLRKLARGVDAAVCSAHALLADRLLPQLEQLAFRLGELRGLALWAPWRRCTGLHPGRVAAAQRAALGLALRGQAVRRTLVKAGAAYRCFFGWLLTVIRRMSEDSPDALAGYPLGQLEGVGAFLAGQYGRDEVGAMLGAADDDAGEEKDCGGGSPLAAPAGDGMLELVLEVLNGRPEAAAAGDSAAGGSPASAAHGGGGGGDSLGRLLGNVRRACAAALGGTPEVVGPTLRLASTQALGPPPAALAAAYVGGEVVVAAAWEGQPLVLLARRQEGQPGAGQGLAAEAEAEGLQGALVRLPAGTCAADLAVYKGGQLALLLAAAAGDEQQQEQQQQPGGGTCHLLLLPPEQLRWEPLPGELGLDGGAGEAAAQPLPEGCRRRLLPYPRVQAPLAVSASRGVGCVLAGTQRALLFDLEEDEEGEEGEEEEGGEECFDSPPRS